MGNRQDFSTEKQSLKDKLMAIILLETSKDYKEMDSDLVTECVDFLMELEGKEKLTTEETKKRVDSIPFEGKITAVGSQSKKKIRTKRLVIIAAVLAVLLAIFSIFAISFTNSEDGLIDRFAQYIVGDMKQGEHKKFNTIEMIKPNDTKTYSSVEELVRAEKMTILFPTWLPDDNRITECQYLSDNVQGDYYCFFSLDSECSISVYPDTVLPKEIKETYQIKKIGKYEVYIVDRNGYVQGDFEHNGCFYSVSAHTEDDVLNIIENLKEIK